MNSIKQHVLAAALLTCATAQAQQGPFLQLANRAIASEDGFAEQRFTGEEPWVQKIRMALKSSGPVNVQAQVLHRYQQEGCGRVQFVFLIPNAGVPATDGGRDAPFSLALNLCTDGQPPMEAVDLKDVAKALNPTAQASTVEPALPPVVPFVMPKRP